MDDSRVMEAALRGEGLLLALLNSAPVSDGAVRDALTARAGRALAASWGGTGSMDEQTTLIRTRAALQAAVRGDGESVVAELDGVLDGVVRTPRVTAAGVHWEIQAPEDGRLAVEAVLAWSNVMTQFPGRLRSCANDECNLFLVDHSRAGTARWCSMAACGNRMKARKYAQRARG